MAGLTPKRERFVREYLVDLNATQAAIRAGYSPKTAEQQGPRLLGNVEVGRAVEEALKRRAERLEVSADNVLRELLRVATCDVGQAFDAEGRMLPLKDMPEDVRRAISSVEVDEIGLPGGDSEGGKTLLGYTKRVRFWDKPKSLELLGKHLKLFTERHEHAFADMTDEQLETRYRELVRPPE